jgi:hypothetical protein
MGIIQKSMECNLYTKIFKTAGRRISKRRPINLNIRIINHRHSRIQDRPRYNLPSVNEIAAILTRDGLNQYQDRDIVAQYHGGSSDTPNDQPKFKRISALHSAYIPLGFSFFFSYGSDVQLL